MRELNAFTHEFYFISQRITTSNIPFNALKEPEKQGPIAGIGHNEILAFLYPMKHTSTANEDVESYVPGNGGT
jgi:hypothetical protein